MAFTAADRRSPLSRVRATASRPRVHRPHHAAGSPATGVALVLPALAFITVFVLVPLVFAVYISLTDWPLIGAYHFIGLKNYQLLLHDGGFWQSLLYTLIYTAIVTPAILLVGYAMAALVRSGRPGSTVVRTAVFLPYVIGLTTLSFLSLLEFQPQSGMVNAVFKAIGLSDGTTAWLIRTVPATGAVCALVVWAASGLTMVLLMSGMQAIPENVYEAAEIDGATGWRKEALITLPLLRRTIGLSLILSVIGSFLAFNQFFILTQGGPGTSTNTVVLWIYQKAFVDLHVGEATAASLVLVLVIAAVSVVQLRLLRDED